MVQTGIELIIFEKVFNELFDYLKSKSSMFNKQKINAVASWAQATNVENVKTIWQVDKNVNLNEFYCASKIKVEGERVEIGSLNDFPENGKIVLQGIAGQGKSIFLRYLTGKELKQGETLPIFIELRRVSEKLTIEDLIVSHLLELGIEVTTGTLKHVFESNKCTLLLDAFDEIPRSEIKSTIDYVENLCAKYYDLKILITARPNTDIQKVTYFKVIELAELNASDFPGFFDKLFKGDKEKIDDILRAIHNSNDDIINLIKTPLLLTLLVITYKSYNKIPEKLYEFYEHLFHLLVNRHDSTKPGFKREYSSGLNENQLENLFCAFCFYCMLENKTSFSNNEAIECVTKAKCLTHMEFVCENDFLTDSTKNTCLIVKEGFEYHFLHKSIREFYAAYFIKNSTLILKEKFYSMALKRSHMYLQELSYLNAIDEFYFNKLFLIPYYEGLFDCYSFDGAEMSLSDNLLSGCEITYKNGKASGLRHSSLFSFPEYGMEDPSCFLINGVFTSETPEKYKNGTFEDIPAEDVLLNTPVYDEIYNDITECLRRNYKDFNVIKNRVEKEEKIINEIGF